MKYSVLMVSTALAAAVGGTAFAQGGAPAGSYPKAWSQTDIDSKSAPATSDSRGAGRAGGNTGLFGGPSRSQNDSTSTDSSPSSQQSDRQSMTTSPSSDAGSSGTYSRGAARYPLSEVAPWDAPTR